MARNHSKPLTPESLRELVGTPMHYYQNQKKNSDREYLLGLQEAEKDALRTSMGLVNLPKEEKSFAECLAEAQEEGRLARMADPRYNKAIAGNPPPASTHVSTREWKRMQAKKQAEYRQSLADADRLNSLLAGLEGGE